MKESEMETHNNGVVTESDANATVSADSSVSIRSIFKEGAPSKKVIVIQSPGLTEDEHVQGELPDLMDAVNRPANVSSEHNSQTTSDIVYETNNQSADSVETISAIEGQGEETSVLEESLNDANKSAEGTDFVTIQDDQVISGETQELIYLNPDESKDEDVQYIGVSTPHQIANELQATDVISQALHQAGGETLDLDDRPPLKLSMPKRVKQIPYNAKDDAERTRFLCPVCQKSFRQKHLLLCHIKLHDARPKNNSVYMSNCTTCGGNVRLTSEQARLLQERGTEDARIICSTCKLLGHDVIQQQQQQQSPQQMQQQKSIPLDLKSGFNFSCDMCSCDIKLTDDQLQLVERKGAENIRIICAPCSLRDQEILPDNRANAAAGNEIKCGSCRRTIVVPPGDMESVNYANPVCAECQVKFEEDLAVDNISCPSYNCSQCAKELFFAEEPPRGVEIVCDSCKTKNLERNRRSIAPPRGGKELHRESSKYVEGLAVMYKCNICFCSMQLPAEQKELLRARGVSGTKIICSSCHAKENTKSVTAKKIRRFRTYQCDICFSDMDLNYYPKDDDDIICATCRKHEEKESAKNKKKNQGGELFAPVNRCCTCNKTLPLSQAQIMKLQDKCGRARLKCEACKRKTDEEIKMTKKIITSEDGVDYRCDICSISFGTSFDDFTEHFSRVHVPDSDTESALKNSGDGKIRRKLVIHCPICDASFRDRYNLKMHLNTHRPVPAGKKKSKRACPMCSELLEKNAMFEHYKDVHSVAMDKMTYNFKTVDDLKDWKDAVEKATFSKFVTANGMAKTIKGVDGVLVSLKCARNIVKKSKFAVKSGFYCPAKIDIQEDPMNGYTVDFTETHVGHGDLSCFSEHEKAAIADMLRADHGIEEIIEELRKDYDVGSPDFVRINLLKCVDPQTLEDELGTKFESNKHLKRKDTTSDDDSGSSGSEFDGNYVDMPEEFSWLGRTHASNGQEPGGRIQVELGDAEDGCRLELKVPPVSGNQNPLLSKKIDILRRIASVLNDSSCEDHLDIVEVYLSPCEQTLKELSSGRTVEIVDEEEITENSEPTNEEDTETSPPPEKRSKNELSDTASVI